VATLPAALPPLVGVLAFLLLYGDAGVVTRVARAALGLRDGPWRLTGAWAIVFVHAYTMYVYVYLFVAAGLERLDPSLDEAAAGLGARRARRFGRVTLPLLAPALAGSMLLVFMSSLGSYSAPYVFGGGLRVLSTQIVASRLNGDEGIAYVETTVLAVSAIAAVLLLRRLEGRGPRASSLGKGVRAERRPVARGGARWLVAGLAAVAVLFLVLPHLALVLVAFAKDGAWTTELLPPVYTLDNWRRVTSDPELVRPVRNSVAMALAATGGNVLVCGLAAYLVVLRRFRGRRLLALLLSLPWAVPATAVAVGLASTFDRHQPLAFRWVLVGTWAILPLAYFIRGVPLVANAVEGSLRQMDPAIEEAARGLGASWARPLWRVVLPAARPGLVAGATLALITGVGEFVASVVLYTHRNRPISVEILAELRALSFGGAAAYSVLLIGIVLAVTLAARLLGEERRTPADRAATLTG
jgi:iron(III) transport system permease protein